MQPFIDPNSKQHKEPNFIVFRWWDINSKTNNKKTIIKKNNKHRHIKKNTFVIIKRKPKKKIL